MVRKSFVTVFAEAKGHREGPVAPPDNHVELPELTELLVSALVARLPLVTQRSVALVAGLALVAQLADIAAGSDALLQRLQFELQVVFLKFFHLFFTSFRWTYVYRDSVLGKSHAIAKPGAVHGKIGGLSPN